MPISIRSAFRRKSVPIDDDAFENSSPKSSFKGRFKVTSASRQKCPPTSSKRRIQTSDISLVMDISAEDSSNPEGFSQGQPFSEEDLHCDKDERSHSPPLILDKDIVDQFPLPPVGLAFQSDACIPKSSEFCSNEAMLPPLPPRVQEYLAKEKADRSLHRQPLVRSSSVTSYSQPTRAAYAALLKSNSVSTSSLPPYQSGGSDYGHSRIPYNSRSDMNYSSPHMLEDAPGSRPLISQKSHTDVTSLPWANEQTQCRDANRHDSLRSAQSIIIS